MQTEKTSSSEPSGPACSSITPEENQNVLSELSFSFNGEGSSLTELEFTSERDPEKKQNSNSPGQPDRGGPNRNNNNLLFKLLAISLIASAGMALIAPNGERPLDDAALREKLSPDELVDPVTGISDVVDVDTAITLLKEGKFEQEAREVENHFSGLFSYEFKVKASAAGRPDRLLRVTGLEGASEERQELLAALKEAKMIVKSGVQTIDDGKQEPSPWVQMVPTLLFYGVIIGGLVWLMRRARGAGGPGDMGTGEAKVYEQGQVNTRFKDVGGLSHIVDELQELTKKIDLKQRGRPVELPRGILMDGPPGVGKTLLARAIAGEANCPVVVANASDLTTEMYVGTGVRKVKNIFKKVSELAKKETVRLQSSPGASGHEKGVVILFIDEIDSIGVKRSSSQHDQGSSSEQNKVTNVLLHEMDGFEKEKDYEVILIGATNNPDILDDALKRPGRFSKIIHIDLPRTAEQRKEIIEALERQFITRKGYAIEDRSAIDYICKITPGKSGDELRQILVEATEIAQLDSRKLITKDDLFESAQRLDSGRLKKNYLPREKHELVAHHEHGHALLSLACGVNVFLVSMLPRGNSAGRVIPDPQGLSETMATRKDYLSRILLGAGGRAAEYEAYGDSGITDGAVSDIEQIRHIVGNMITVGMIDDMYATNLRYVPVHQWGDQHKQAIDTITTRAIQFGRKIIQEVGAEKMSQLVDDSLELNGELVGIDAMQFYLDRLDSDTMDKIRRIAGEFISSPLRDPDAPAAEADQLPGA